MNTTMNTTIQTKTMNMTKFKLYNKKILCEMYQIYKNIKTRVIITKKQSEPVHHDDFWWSLDSPKSRYQ